MSTQFRNPRNPMVALWASVVEKHVREQNPELPTQEVRRHPMMQGVYLHSFHIKQKKRVSNPRLQGNAASSGSPEEMAYLSQLFLDHALTVTFSQRISADTPYETYITLLDTYNNYNDIADFSTADLGGFALCLIVWVYMAASEGLTTLQKKCLHYLMEALPLTDEQKQQIKAYLDGLPDTSYSVQYRDPSQYPNYKAIPWTLPAKSQVVMIGDWGTALDDAKQFLKAIWRKAFQTDPTSTIVFIHLGDIYYCGLEYECEHYFREVFVQVGAELKAEFNDNRFNSNPVIFTLPGNHEYYSYGYGYFKMLDELNKGVPGIPDANIRQQCSFFCLRTADSKWQFLGMDTGQADGNGLLSALQAGGDYVYEKVKDTLPDWDWLSWVEDLALSTWEDFVGPFSPSLRSNEMNWHKDRLSEFSGKTILLSHHQLFSRQAEIQHSNPQYMNTWLYKNFKTYFSKKIAAWYWGHEHTFAVYLDGLMGLNKGRLLGSSSYEAFEGEDGPYNNNYPMIPFGPKMTNTLVNKNSEGLYYHAGAILTMGSSSVAVKYYQFPAWSQLDTAPTNPQLTEITAVEETITTTFKSLENGWIGNKTLSQSSVQSNMSPALAEWKDHLYVLYGDNSSDHYLYMTTADVSSFKPTSKDAAPTFNAPVKVKVGGNSVKTVNSPAVIAVNGSLYAFYRDGNGYINVLSAAANGSSPSSWTNLGKLGTKAGDQSPSVCFFQGRIYMVYRKSGSDNSSQWAFFDVVTHKWTDLGDFKNSSGTVFKTSCQPGLAADGFHIYMAYRTTSDSKLAWAVATPSSSVPNGVENNLTWASQGNIVTSVNGSTYTPTSAYGPALIYSSGTCLMCFVKSDNTLHTCMLAGVDQDSTGNWIGNDPVTVNINSSSSSTAQSNKTVTMAVASGGWFMIFKGKSSNNIYWAYY